MSEREHADLIEYIELVADVRDGLPEGWAERIARALFEAGVDTLDGGRAYVRDADLTEAVAACGYAPADDES